jgi:FdhD protein
MHVPEKMMIPPLVRVPRSVYRSSGNDRGERAIPEETAIAFTFNTASYAVMMATPQDLEDFAIGFSLTEGVVPSSDAIESVEIVEGDVGIELRIWLKASDAAEFLGRRRKMAGPTGCGLCGIESLVEAMRPPPSVDEGLIFTPDQIMTAVNSLFPRQALNHETRAVHAAGFWHPARGLVAVREDVGRHNALDKLAGALVRENATAQQGIIVLTSRVSVEMVQKSAAIRGPIIVAVSAPTALAVRMANAAGLTLVAVARKDGFEVFTHPHRVKGALSCHVA